MTCFYASLGAYIQGIEAPVQTEISVTCTVGAGQSSTVVRWFSSLFTLYLTDTFRDFDSDKPGTFLFPC